MKTNTTADRLTDLTVYSNRPWLIEGSPACLDSLFADAPEEIFPVKTEFFFGAENFVYRIDSGLIATYALYSGIQNSMMGLFGTGSMLGAFKAILHKHGTIALVSKPLLPTRVRKVSVSRFLDFLEHDDAVGACVYRELLAQHECHMEGVLLNGILPVDVRIARIVATLFDAAGAEMTEQSSPLPTPLTVMDLAELVHADRAFVSRILTKWKQEGLYERRGRELCFSARILERESC